MLPDELINVVNTLRGQGFSDDRIADTIRCTVADVQEVPREADEQPMEPINQEVGRRTVTVMTPSLSHRADDIVRAKGVANRILQKGVYRADTGEAVNGEGTDSEE